LRRYRNLYQARQDTWEGNSRRAVEKLGNVPNEVAGFIRAAAYDKLYHAAWLVKRLANEGKRVMVYAKFRQSAHRLQRVLWDEYNMLVETFMDGDPPSKLADLKEKARVVIFTPVALEGLDLPEFDCLVHISAISDEFTRRQIRGRIRVGEEYYVVFKDTNDEWKLRVDVPEPEGPLRPVEVGEVDEGKGLSGHYLEADGKAFKYPFVIIVDELEMADVKFRRVMRSCYPTRILPSFKVNMRSTSDAPTIADKLVGDTNLKNKALDYYKDLILAIISTSALLITISLSLVTLSYTSNLLGVRLSSKTTIGYSSFFLSPFNNILNLFLSKNGGSPE
jgi:hypothetical protein